MVVSSQQRPPQEKAPSDAGRAPAPAEDIRSASGEAEQDELWRRVGAVRWHQRKSVRALALLVLLVGTAAVVPYPLYVTSECTVIPSERVYVRSRAEGVLAEILVGEGDQVRAGDVIARLDDRELQADRRKMIADISRIEADLARLRKGTRREEIEEQRVVVGARANDVQFARKEATRLTKLARIGVSSKQSADEAAHDLAIKRKAAAGAKARLRLLLAGARTEDVTAQEAVLERARAELAYIEQQLSDLEISSPIGGVVLTPRFRERLYERVEAGGIVCEVANTARMRAEIFVPERDLDIIAKGLPVTVKVESYPLNEFAGTVGFIAPAVERTEDAGRVRVIAQLDNPGGLLKRDMHGYGEIDCGKRSVLHIFTRRVVRWFRVRFLI